MSRHTPGPWRVLDGAILSENLNDYGNWIVVSCGRERTRQDAANLCLIAAAPDLLSVCERVLRAIHWGATSDRLTQNEMADLLTEVIAKAQGEQQ